MKCIKCNSENANDANVCQECGKSLHKKIFISHHSKDKKIANALLDLLIKVTRIDSHFCSSKYGNIKYGDKWYETIVEELEECNYVICLLTANSYEQPWILYEAGIAKGMEYKKEMNKNKKIICLLLDIPGDYLNTSPLSINQYCVNDEKDESLFTLMKQIYEDFHPNNKLCLPIEKSIKSDIQEFKKDLKKKTLKNISI